MGWGTGRGTSMPQGVLHPWGTPELPEQHWHWALVDSHLPAAAGRPVILLLFNAGPLDVSWAQAHEGVGAILACFFPAQATGLAIAKVLLGEAGANPAGRLPATWPAGMHQVKFGQLVALVAFPCLGGQGSCSMQG